MKKLLILLVFFITHLPVFSQLTVDAGSDTAVCVTWNWTSQLTLGGSSVVQGGSPPYQYSWKTTYYFTVGSNTYELTASDFLSDTSIANPTMILHKEDPVTFVLTVTDSDSNMDSDTVTVYFSYFNSHLNEYEHTMQVGDSVKFVSLPNVGGGTAPLTYLWRPNHGLTDSISYSDFWLKPITTTSYYITVTDAWGCVVSGSPMFHIIIGSLSLENLSDGEHELILYPNPTSGKLFLETDEPIREVSFFDTHLNLVHTYTNVLEIELAEFPSGTYFIEVNMDNKRYFKKVLLVK